MSDRVAVLDCGTNTVRLVIMKSGDDGLKTLERIKHDTLLGERVAGTKQISPAALRRAREMAEQYAMLIKQHGVAPENIYAIGTASLRDAENAGAFKEILREELGQSITVKVLSGEEEAGLTGDAVHDFADRTPPPYVVVDLGGGSCEIVVGQHPDEMTEAVSVDLGSRWLAATLQSDPPSARKLNVVQKTIDEKLESDGARELLDHACDVSVIAVGGTAKQLAKLNLKAKNVSDEGVHGAELTLEELRDWVNQLESVSVEERKAMEGMKKSRAATVLPGAMVLLSILEAVRDPSLKDSSMIVSKHSVADAFAARKLREMGTATRIPSPYTGPEVGRAPHGGPSGPPNSRGSMHVISRK